MFVRHNHDKSSHKPISPLFLSPVQHPKYLFRFSFFLRWLKSSQYCMLQTLRLLAIGYRLLALSVKLVHKSSEPGPSDCFWVISTPQSSSILSAKVLFP